MPCFKLPGDYSEDFEDSEFKEDSKAEQAVTSEANVSI